VEDRDAPRPHGSLDLVEQQRRGCHEAGDPAAPARVHAARRQRIGHEIELVIFDIRDAVTGEHGAASLYEARGALDRHHPALWTHDVGEIGRREAGSRADVQHLRPRTDAGAPPALEHGGPPDAVLQSEPFQFLVVCAQEVRALGGHRQSHLALRSR
jgi:hypothetical protein